MLDGSLNHLDALILTFTYTLDLRHIEPTFSVKGIDSFLLNLWSTSGSFFRAGEQKMEHRRIVCDFQLHNEIEYYQRYYSCQHTYAIVHPRFLHL